MVSATPTAAFALVGRVTANDPATPFGNAVGALWTLTTGYSAGSSAGGTASTAQFSNITLALGGMASWYSSSGTGTVTLQTGGGPGPGTGENRPPVANAGEDFSAVAPQIQLNGTQSSDPDNDTITYSWRLVSGSAVLLQANTANAIAQLAGGFGTYVFELTVTDPDGLTATDSVTVTFVR
jgi:hypothetical protein